MRSFLLGAAGIMALATTAADAQTVITREVAQQPVMVTQPNETVITQDRLIGQPVATGERGGGQGG